MQTCKFYISIICAFLLSVGAIYGQELIISGSVLQESDESPLDGVIIIINNNKKEPFETNQMGLFSMLIKESLPIKLSFTKRGYEDKNVSIDIDMTTTEMKILLSSTSVNLNEVNIVGKGNPQQMTPMPAVSGLSIYSGMKSEIIRLSNVTANLSVNNSRQVYNRIAGLNIWENDGAGIQLGIGARGLSPNRTSNFNVRQNLYEISADALGYPESYYTPSLLGVERIELIRGAAALQYGTQFGGLLNFQMKKPPKPGNRNITVHQSIGSYGIQDSLTGSLASSSTYIEYGDSWDNSGVYLNYQLKQGSGWRLRSDYEVHSVFATFHRKFGQHWTGSIDLTHMSYMAEQPGGLIDKTFNINPRITNRFRNWFKVNWNIVSTSIGYNPNPKVKVELKLFGLLASRDALGYLGQTQRPDPLESRDLISSKFKNIGAETRLIHKKEIKSGFLVTAAGLRVYNGASGTQQGVANSSDLAEFEFNSVAGSEYSDYDFPNYNVAAFAQTLLPLNKRISFTPGLRYEYIDTRSDGSYRNITRDAANNIIEDTLLFDKKRRERDFLLFGIGANYSSNIGELYMNVGQNYRAINFTDIQVRNTSLVIDPNIKDERGSNIDLGLRGNVKRVFQFDVSAFVLQYNNRIGEYFAADQYNRAVRIRSNIASARTVGLELFLQDEISSHFQSDDANYKLSVFVNTSIIDSKYVDSEVQAFDNKDVELVPNYTIRTGVAWKSDHFDGSIQYSFVGDQFSDATNVGSNPEFPATVNAVHGLIPAYTVMDVSVAYKLKSWKCSFSINNLANTAYFTRRASGYPGPGIIPSDGRNFHLGVEWKISKSKNS